MAVDFNDVPNRVKLAIHFCLNMANRAGPSANDGIVIEPYPLELKEIEAWRASCDVITGFFNNNLEPNIWEAQLYTSLYTENERRKVGKISQCACVTEDNGETKINPNCKLCDGSGKILIYPYNG